MVSAFQCVISVSYWLQQRQVISMKTIQKNSIRRTRKQIKLKIRSEDHISLGTPQVPLSTVLYKQQHELLSDWDDAS